MFERDINKLEQFFFVIDLACSFPRYSPGEKCWDIANKHENDSYLKNHLRRDNLLIKKPFSVFRPSAEIAPSEKKSSQQVTDVNGTRKGNIQNIVTWGGFASKFPTILI